MAEQTRRSGGDTAPTPPRRKVRKGTQSCWECKRRKIRCTLATSRDPICDGCRSRQTRCIRQEFPDEGARATKSDSLRRMETLVEHLAKHIGTSNQGLLSQARRDQGERRHHPSDNAPISLDPVSPATSGVLLAPSLGVREAYGSDKLSHALLNAWPSQHDLDLILSIPVSTSVLFHGLICASHASYLRKSMTSPREMLKPPLPGLHPVLVARKLLMLATFLQGVPSCSTERLDSLSSDYRDLRSHLVETASRLVTSNDDLVGSIEGIECIMIESMYQNNAGHLRRAWLTNRRAMTLAQMMGLHSGANWEPAKILESETRARVNPEHMWFRLVASDRYLSMMLGLPQASLDSDFAAPKTLECCTPMERMERLDTMAGGLILQRNSSKLQDPATTYEIDKILQKAADSMPAQWWLAPDLASVTGNDAHAFSETIRLMGHFAHFHVLAQLHLPYLLYSTDRRHDYNKITAMNSSREILTRFVSLRHSDSAVATYCRGVDFLAFIASTTLCLAHIEANRHKQIESRETATIFHFLAHQRLGDRGLMERTVESMEHMVRDSDDAIARDVAEVLRHLLIIETDAAEGTTTYSTSASYGVAERSQCGGSVSDSGNVLQVNIPYIGTLKIERDDRSKPVTAVQTTAEKRLQTAATSQTSDPSSELWSPGSRLLSHQEQELEPLNTWTSTRQPAVIGTSTQSLNSDWQAMSPPLSAPYLTQQPEAGRQGISGFNADTLQEEDLLMPASTSSFDDWTLQDVDTALFQSLIQGAMELEKGG